MSMTALR